MVNLEQAQVNFEKLKVFRGIGLTVALRDSSTSLGMTA
jgi:hypothetical protein